MTAFFAGLDWASQSHAVCIIDDHGNVRARVDQAPACVCAEMEMEAKGELARSLADDSRHASAWAAHVYNRARARGCDHPHAVRILARAWVRVIWRAWTDRKPYDPTRHGAAQLLTKLAGG
jgi:hypothetical protein